MQAFTVKIKTALDSFTETFIAPTSADAIMQAVDVFEDALTISVMPC